MRPLVLLRPEPGLSQSAARARALGLDVVECPLFDVGPLDWQVPHPDAFDGLLLTSANAVRHDGAGLEALRGLPVHAVGEATAQAAREAGFAVATVGDSDATALLDILPTESRLLHLCGAHRAPGSDDPRVDHVAVYESRAIKPVALPGLEGAVVAVHSPRAGRRLAELAGERHHSMICAISETAAQACGDGWERVEWVGSPEDSHLLALAARLCHTSPDR